MITPRQLGIIMVGWIWFCNINDLIRGDWFFLSISAIIYWNLFGIAMFILLLLDYKDEIKKLKEKKKRRTGK